MAFYGFAATLIVWVLWAYKMGFGIYMLPFVGRPGPVVTMAQELGQSCLPSAALCQNFPLSTMVYFQFVFAAITIVIMAGAFLGRMNFRAWMIFVPLWITFSYTIGAYSLWGGGFLFQRGVIDYSGGYVIHISSGTAGFVGAHWIGPRLAADREDSRPNNILCVLIGAGILWIGWNGFNGGDPYAASADAGAAVLNTNVATAIILQYTAPVWVLLYTVLSGGYKPSLRRSAAVGLAVMGCALAVGFVGSGGLRLDPVGVIAALLAAFSFAFYNVAGHSVLGRYDRWKVLLWVLASAATFWMFINPPWKIVSAHYALRQWGFMLIFSLLSVLGPFSCYFAGLQYLEPTRAVVVSCLEPVFSIVIAAIALGELLRPLQTLGIVVVLVAIVLIQWPGATGREELILEPIE